jgi:hypothetical protein
VTASLKSKLKNDDPRGGATTEKLFILMLSAWVLAQVILFSHRFLSDQGIETAVSRQLNASNN